MNINEEDITAQKSVVDNELFPDGSAMLTDQEIINSSRLISEMAIPIPDKIGELFSRRWQNSILVSEQYHKDWLVNLKHFHGSEDGSQSDFPQENITRTTVETLVDYTYMRNPSAEISTTEDGDRELTEVLERALKTLTSRRAYPGINLRPKVIKQIVYSHLTNLGCLKVKFQPMRGSLDEAQQLFKALQKKIKKTKDTTELETHYAGLRRLYDEMESRSMFGIGLSVVSPFNLHIPAGTQEVDLSDCPWLMEEEQIETAHIRSEYMIYDEEENCYRFRYNNNTIFTDEQNKTPDRATIAEAIIDQIMPDVEDTQRRVISENTTPCIWVYDRASRLIYLYLRDRWDVPLWVFEDEMKLSSFYPHVLLEFSTPLNSVYQKGEVSRYIPYQKEINEIEKTKAIIRRVAARIFTYDSQTIDKLEIEKVFSEAMSSNEAFTAIGVKLKDRERRLEDCYSPLVMPAAQLEQFLDKTELRESIERSSRISEALRGAEFRVNTTNAAIQTYNNFAQTRLEGITDKIEEAMERLFWMLTELIVSKYDKNTIISLVPQRMADKFVPMEVQEFNEKYFLTIAAGSIEKMTSSNKKKEANALIQGLGQFGKSAPRTTLKIIFRMIRETFSQEIITDEDIAELIKETEQMMQMSMMGSTNISPMVESATAPETQPVV